MSEVSQLPSPFFLRNLCFWNWVSDFCIKYPWLISSCLSILPPIRLLPTICSTEHSEENAAWLLRRGRGHKGTPCPGEGRQPSHPIAYLYSFRGKFSPAPSPGTMTEKGLRHGSWLAGELSHLVVCTKLIFFTFHVQPLCSQHHSPSSQCILWNLVKYSSNLKHDLDAISFNPNLVEKTEVCRHLPRQL